MMDNYKHWNVARIFTSIPRCLSQQDSAPHQEDLGVRGQSKFLHVFKVFPHCLLCFLFHLWLYSSMCQKDKRIKFPWTHCF